MFKIIGSDGHFEGGKGMRSSRYACPSRRPMIGPEITGHCSNKNIELRLESIFLVYKISCLKKMKS